MQEAPMPSVDELERLSRYHQGELGAGEGAGVERDLASRPDLRDGLEVLKSLDGAAAVLPHTLDGEALEALLGGVPRPGAQRGAGPLRWGMVAAAVLLAAAAFLGLRPARPALALSWGDGLNIDGVPVHGRGPQILREGTKVQTHQSGAQLLGVDGVAWLPPEAEAAWSDRAVQLISGTAMISGDSVEVRGAGVA